MVFSSPLEAALARREVLRQILKLFYEYVKEDSENLSVVSLPPKYSKPIKLYAAEDGGHRAIDFEAYTLYIIKASSLCIENSEGINKIIFEKSVADVNVAIPPLYIEERISLYREIMELWASLRLLESCRPEVFFWDGSLRPLLARHRPGASVARGYTKLFSNVFERLGITPEPQDLVDNIRKEELKGPLAVHRIISNHLTLNEIKDKDAEWISFLEWLEKLLLLSKFLKKGWEQETLLIFITKTSRSTSLFGRSFPDIYYLRMIKPFKKFRTSGRLRRTAVEVIGLDLQRLRDVGPMYPSVSPIREVFMNRLGLIEFYARLSDGSPMLKFEIAIDLDRFGLIDSDLVEEIIVEALRKILTLPIVEGYPYILKLVHERSRVTKEEVEKVLQALGLDIERGGREVLK